MTDTQGFTIEIKSSFAEWWRYNVAVMCGCFDASGQRTGFASTEDRIAEIGANLNKIPNGYPEKRETILSTPECDNIVLYIYIIPNTLPSDRGVGECRPFGIDVKISYVGKLMSSEKIDINQWSGASIEKKISCRQ